VTGVAWPRGYPFRPGLRLTQKRNSTRSRVNSQLNAPSSEVPSMQMVIDFPCGSRTQEPTSRRNSSPLLRQLPRTHKAHSVPLTARVRRSVWQLVPIATLWVGRTPWRLQHERESPALHGRLRVLLAHRSIHDCNPLPSTARVARAALEWGPSSTPRDDFGRSSLRLLLTWPSRRRQALWLQGLPRIH